MPEQTKTIVVRLWEEKVHEAHLAVPADYSEDMIDTFVRENAWKADVQTVVHLRSIESWWEEEQEG